MREIILISGAEEGQLDESSFIHHFTIVRTKWHSLNNCYCLYTFGDGLESYRWQVFHEYTPLVRSLKKAISERKLTHIIQGIQEVGVRSEAEIIFTWQNFGGGV